MDAHRAHLHTSRAPCAAVPRAVHANAKAEAQLLPVRGYVLPAQEVPNDEARAVLLLRVSAVPQIPHGSIRLSVSLIPF